MCVLYYFMAQKNKNSIPYTRLIIEYLNKDCCTSKELREKIGLEKDLNNNSFNSAIKRLIKDGCIEVKNDNLKKLFVLKKYCGGNFISNDINYELFIKKLNSNESQSNTDLVNYFSQYSIILLDKDPFYIPELLDSNIDLNKYISDAIIRVFGNKDDFEGKKNVYFRRKFLDKLIKFGKEDSNIDCYVYKYINPIQSNNLYKYLTDINPIIKYSLIPNKNKIQLGYDMFCFDLDVDFSASSYEEYKNSISDDFDPNEVNFYNSEDLRFIEQFEELWDSHNTIIRPASQIGVVKFKNMVLLFFNLSSRQEYFAFFVASFIETFSNFLKN